eukprot:UN28569
MSKRRIYRGSPLRRLLTYFCKDWTSEAYFGLNQVFCNISQNECGRRVLSKNLNMMIPILKYGETKTCQGLLKMIKNIALGEKVNHKAILDNKLGLINELSLYLAGPSAELDEEDEQLVIKVYETEWI